MLPASRISPRTRHDGYRGAQLPLSPEPLPVNPSTGQQSIGRVRRTITQHHHHGKQDGTPRMTKQMVGLEKNVVTPIEPTFEPSSEVPIDSSIPTADRVSSVALTPRVRPAQLARRRNHGSIGSGSIGGEEESTVSYYTPTRERGRMGSGAAETVSSNAAIPVQPASANKRLFGIHSSKTRASPPDQKEQKTPVDHHHSSSGLSRSSAAAAVGCTGCKKLNDELEWVRKLAESLGAENKTLLREHRKATRATQTVEEDRQRLIKQLMQVKKENARLRYLVDRPGSGTLPPHMVEIQDPEQSYGASSSAGMAGLYPSTGSAPLLPRLKIQAAHSASVAQASSNEHQTLHSAPDRFAASSTTDLSSSTSAQTHGFSPPTNKRLAQIAAAAAAESSDSSARAHTSGAIIVGASRTAQILSSASTNSGDTVDDETGPSRLLSTAPSRVASGSSSFSAGSGSFTSHPFQSTLSTSNSEQSRLNPPRQSLSRREQHHSSVALTRPFTPQANPIGPEMSGVTPEKAPAPSAAAPSVANTAAATRSGSKRGVRQGGAAAATGRRNVPHAVSVAQAPAVQPSPNAVVAANTPIAGAVDVAVSTPAAPIDEEVSLMYDPILQCYYDPKENKYYQLHT